MQSKGSKTMIMLLAVLAAMFFGYMTLFNGGGATEETASLEAEQSGAGQEIIAILNRLEGLRLDNRIFTLREFKALKDETRPILDEPVGRNNPFAPIGTGGYSGEPAAATAAVAATTTKPAAPKTGSVKAN